MFGGMESRCQRQHLGKIQHSVLELMHRMSVELDPSLIPARTLPYEYTLIPIGYLLKNHMCNFNPWLR